MEVGIIQLIIQHIFEIINLVMVLPIHNLQWDLRISDIIQCGNHPKFNIICNLICKYLIINLENRLVILTSNNLSNLFNLIFRYLHQVEFNSLVRVHLEL